MKIRSLNPSPKPYNLRINTGFAVTLKEELVCLERKYLVFVETCTRLLQENHSKLQIEQSFYEPGSMKHNKITAEKENLENELSELEKTQQDLSFSGGRIKVYELLIKKTKEVEFSVSNCHNQEHNKQIESQFDSLYKSIKELLICEKQELRKTDARDDAEMIFNTIPTDKANLQRTIHNKEKELKQQDSNIKKLKKQIKSITNEVDYNRIAHSHRIVSPVIQTIRPNSSHRVLSSQCSERTNISQPSLDYFTKSIKQISSFAQRLIQETKKVSKNPEILKKCEKFHMKILEKVSELKLINMSPNTAAQTDGSQCSSEHSKSINVKNVLELVFNQFSSEMKDKTRTIEESFAMSEGKLNHLVQTNATALANREHTKRQLAETQRDHLRLQIEHQRSSQKNITLEDSLRTVQVVLWKKEKEASTKMAQATELANLILNAINYESKENGLISSLQLILNYIQIQDSFQTRRLSDMVNKLQTKFADIHDELEHKTQQDSHSQQYLEQIRTEFSSFREIFQVSFKPNHCAECIKLAQTITDLQSQILNQSSHENFKRKIEEICVQYGQMNTQYLKLEKMLEASKVDNKNLFDEIKRGKLQARHKQRSVHHLSQVYSNGELSKDSLNPKELGESRISHQVSEVGYLDSVIKDLEVSDYHEQSMQFEIEFLRNEILDFQSQVKLLEDKYSRLLLAKKVVKTTISDTQTDILNRGVVQLPCLSIMCKEKQLNDRDTQTMSLPTTEVCESVGVFNLKGKVRDTLSEGRKSSFLNSEGENSEKARTMKDRIKYLSERIKKIDTEKLLLMDRNMNLYQELNSLKETFNGIQSPNSLKEELEILKTEHEDILSAHSQELSTTKYNYKNKICSLKTERTRLTAENKLLSYKCEDIPKDFKLDEIKERIAALGLITSSNRNTYETIHQLINTLRDIRIQDVTNTILSGSLTEPLVKLDERNIDCSDDIESPVLFDIPSVTGEEGSLEYKQEIEKLKYKLKRRKTIIEQQNILIFSLESDNQVINKA